MLLNPTNKGSGSVSRGLKFTTQCYCVLSPASSLSSHHLLTCTAAGCHSVRALQDHGAGEGGGRPPAPTAGLPAEGRRRVSVTATDQQPQGSGAGSGEKGLGITFQHNFPAGPEPSSSYKTHLVCNWIIYRHVNCVFYCMMSDGFISI